MPRFFRVAWQHWKVIAEAIAHVQARLIFGLLYFLVVTPFALAVKIFSDPLQLRPTEHGTHWRDMSRQTVRLDDARRQF